MITNDVGRILYYSPSGKPVRPQRRGMLAEWKMRRRLKKEMRGWR